MARESKFNFILAHQVTKIFAEDREWRVTVMTKPQKAITFPSRHPETQMLVGKWLQFFVDTEKNTIGWKTFKEGELSDLSNCIQVKFSKTRGDSVVVRVPIAPVLKTLDITEGKTYKKLQVEKYKQTGYLNDGRPIYYITLDKPVKNYKKSEPENVKE